MHFPQLNSCPDWETEAEHRYGSPGGDIRSTSPHQTQTGPRKAGPPARLLCLESQRERRWATRCRAPSGPALGALSSLRPEVSMPFPTSCPNPETNKGPGLHRPSGPETGACSSPLTIEDAHYFAGETPRGRPAQNGLQGPARHLPLARDKLLCFKTASSSADPQTHSQR